MAGSAVSDVSRCCLCTEYLSPELIFNLGHNHASDLWALGVIIYEMLMAVTPFAPKRPDNVTELFTNIAMVKKNGLVLSSRIDQHAGNPQARALIAAILKADPAEYVATTVRLRMVYCRCLTRMFVCVCCCVDASV